MIISQVSVAKKYALAYLRLYGQQLTKEDVNNLYRVFLFFKSNHESMHLVYIISMRPCEMGCIFEKLIDFFSLPESIKQVMALLAKHKKLYYLKDVLLDIYCLYKQQHNIVQLQITAAAPLDEQSIQAFEAFFAKQTGKNIESTTVVDTALLAGIRLQSDFFLWEYSVAQRLRTLRHTLGIEGKHGS